MIIKRKRSRRVYRQHTWFNLSEGSYYGEYAFGQALKKEYAEYETAMAEKKCKKEEEKRRKAEEKKKKEKAAASH
jgi:hypothetical protein